MVQQLDAEDFPGVLEMICDWVSSVDSIAIRVDNYGHEREGRAAEECGIETFLFSFKQSLKGHRKLVIDSVNILVSNSDGFQRKI
ncbi:hypothetical protein [Paenibacillus tyrfis]|uniref:hypothetical protein n=1 Tax=Paenibacillus tyrfis TaxID=1501230 RepID=UPI0024939523|nr:hypothetical protein [Paenibacillus tyrfis]